MPETVILYTTWPEAEKAEAVGAETGRSARNPESGPRDIVIDQGLSLNRSKT